MDTIKINKITVHQGAGLGLCRMGPHWVPDGNLGWGIYTINGALDRGVPMSHVYFKCHTSILRNGHVALSNLRN